MSRTTDRESRDLIFTEASGFSMWPFLRPGEKLIIKRVAFETLKIGDIILYRLNQQMVCHRLVKMAKNGQGYLLYTRGDNSPSPPEIVTEQMFLGKAVEIIRDGKAIGLTGWRQQFFSRIIVIIAPGISKGSVLIKRLIKNFIHISQESL